MNRHSTGMTILIVLLNIFLPPLGVLLSTGELGGDFFVDCVLLFFFWLPAVIYAFFCQFGHACCLGKCVLCRL